MTERCIYYAGSITGATGEFKSRAKITIPKLQQHGKVWTEHIAWDDCQEFEAENKRRGVNIFERDIEWLNDSHNMVFDASEPTTGGGMEVMYNAGVLFHPSLVIHDAKVRISNMITQFKHPLLEVQSYGSFDQLDALFADYFARHPLPHTVFPNLVMYDAIDGGGKGAITDAIKQWSEERGKRVFDASHHMRTMQEIPSWHQVKIKSEGCNVLLVNEPTYTWIGKIIRDELSRKGMQEPYSAITTAHALGGDRDVLYKRLVIPALKDGALVASDRGVITSLVYQPIQAEMYSGMSRAFFTGLVRGIPGNNQELNHAPGFLIIPQVDVDVAQARLNAREKKDDSLFEQEEMQRRVAEVYASESLRAFYERRGTLVEYLHVAPGETRDTTVRRAYDFFVEYAARL